MAKAKAVKGRNGKGRFKKGVHSGKVGNKNAAKSPFKKFGK